MHTWSTILLDTFVPLCNLHWVMLKRIFPPRRPSAITPQLITYTYPFITSDLITRSSARRSNYKHFSIEAHQYTPFTPCTLGAKSCQDDRRDGKKRTRIDYSKRVQTVSLKLHQYCIHVRLSNSETGWISETLRAGKYFGRAAQTC